MTTQLPCITVVEFRLPEPKDVTRVYGAFSDTTDGHEAAQELLRECLSNPEHESGYRVTSFEEAVKEFKRYFCCLVDVALEDEAVETADDYAKLFGNLDQAAYCLEEFQEEWYPPIDCEISFLRPRVRDKLNIIARRLSCSQNATTKLNSADVFDIDQFCNYAGELIDEEIEVAPVRFAVQRDDHLELVSKTFKSIDAVFMVLSRLDKDAAKAVRVVFVDDDGEPLLNAAALADAARSDAPLSQVAG